MRSPRAARLAADALVLLLALWLLWPQHRGGYGLGHDMVFTPHQPLNAESVGLGSTSPRAVPLDALVALAGKLLGGELTGRIALLVPLLAAGWGAVRLLNPRRLPAMLLAGGLAVWNPYLVERLALGQWALLWAYGALPWLIRAAVRVRAGSREQSARGGGWPALVIALGASAITPTGALIGAAVALAVGWSAQPRRTGALLLAAVVAQLPWLLPAVLSSAAATSDPRAVAAFAARSERPGGTLLSLLGLGGIWSSDVTPASRAGVLGYLCTLLVLLVLVLGVPLLRSTGYLARLAGLAAGGLLIAVAASVPGLSALLRWAVRELPGAGLLRDGQKWLMPFVLLAILAAGAAMERLAGIVTARLAGTVPDQFTGTAWRGLLAVAAVVLPLLLLPDAPTTLRVPLRPVRYPAGWQAAADAVRGSPDEVLVLPFASYRAFDWAPGRTVIDPAPRLLPAATVVDDRLVVGTTVLAGEDRTAATVARLLAADPEPVVLGSALARQGIGWVLVEATPGPRSPNLSGLRQVLDTPDVRLYRVPGQVDTVRSDSVQRWLVIGTDLLVALLVAVALCGKATLSALGLLHSPVTTTVEEI